MGTFSKAIIRAGFATAYSPSTVVPTTRALIDKQSPADTELSSGTGSGAVDLMYIDQRTLGASANETIDISGGITDPFGTTLNFVTVKGIFIKASTGNTNNVLFKPAASNSFLGPFNAAADQVSIPPGGCFLVTAPATGWAVTAGSGDDIYLANSGAGSSVTYDIHIIGTSA